MDLKYKKGFTLTEVMIVLTVIGVITAILLPVGINSIPNENVMKFKKANNTLGTVIKALVNSDQYFLGGDLSKKADGTPANDLCAAFEESISSKKSHCSGGGYATSGSTLTATDFTTDRSNLDAYCKYWLYNTYKETFYYVIGIDNINWYFIEPFFTKDSKKYTIICVDIDGIPSDSTRTDCVNECPFAYGIRNDGKIIHGQKALDWLDKNIQDKE